MITGHLPELIIVLILGLIVFGPKRLPEIGEAMGKGIRDFKKGMSSMGDDDTTPTAESSRDYRLPDQTVPADPTPFHRAVDEHIVADIEEPIEPAEVRTTQ